MLLLYHIWLKTVWITSPKEHEKRGGKRESAGREESPALTKIMKEINQKHWTANHHHICLQNRISRPGKRSVQFVNDSNLASSGCSVWSSNEYNNTTNNVISSFVNDYFNSSISLRMMTCLFNFTLQLSQVSMPAF